LKVHEYQGKEILRRFGIPTPRGIPAFSVDEAVRAAEALGGAVWVVKAQIHAGGRGKGGGVKLGKSIDDVRELAGQILGMQLVTHQTGPRGQKVRRLLIEEGADIRKELYVGMVVDRTTQRVVLMASSEGGMDIEAVAAKTPDKIHKVFIDPGKGLSDREADGIAQQIGIPEGSVAQARTLLQALYRAFDQTDASTWTTTPCSGTRISSRCAIWTRRIRPRSRPRSSIFRTSRSTATSAAWSMAPGLRWRRWT
jgi:succinyl-CoA synthetase beta subunit